MLRLSTECILGSDCVPSRRYNGWHCTVIDTQVCKGRGCSTQRPPFSQVAGCAGVFVQIFVVWICVLLQFNDCSAGAVGAVYGEDQPRALWLAAESTTVAGGRAGQGEEGRRGRNHIFRRHGSRSKLVMWMLCLHCSITGQQLTAERTDSHAAACREAHRHNSILTAIQMWAQWFNYLKSCSPKPLRRPNHLCIAPALAVAKDPGWRRHSCSDMPP